MANNNTPKWTPEQEAAIDHRTGGAIVDANAGAGKTAVLTTRIVDILSDEQNITDPAGMVIITFTKKAAAELKTRLTKKMKERLAANPDKADFLRRQCASLHKARISTISSFCFSLIRENTELSTLSPGFSIMEESRAQMMRYAICEQAVEDFYKTADQKSLQLIMDHFADKHGDKSLVEAIMDITGYAQNLPEPDGWYSLCKNPARLEKILTDAGKGLKASVTELEEACKALDTAYNEICQIEAERTDNGKKLLKQENNAKACLTASLPFFRNYLDGLTDAVATNDYSKITLSDKDKIKKSLPSFTKTEIGVYSTDVTSAAGILADILEAVRKLISIKSRLNISQAVIDILVDISMSAERTYKEEKSILNVADYADAERQLYNMVKNHPEVRDNAKIELLIVDEFQDSNRLQYEIFRQLSDNEQNLYFVGDMKQSIYAFRGAQSEVFDEVTKNPLYKHLYLNHNFRSRDNVINGINDIFCPVMTTELGGVDYEKNSLLLLGDGTNVSTNPDDITEVIMITDKKNDSESGGSEADYVAYHIDKMIKSGYMVENRPCRADDFTILLRSSSEKAPIFASALAQYDIQSVTKSDGKLFSEPEIVIMTDYLKVIDDPYNNESLARLLMSCIFGFSADDMAAVRTGTLGFDIKAIRETSEECEKELKAYAGYYKNLPLYTCITKAKKGYEINEEHSPALACLYKEKPELFSGDKNNRCKDLVTELDRLRGIMAASSPAELIKHIYDTTSVADLLTVGENAENRRINLMGLLALSEEYDKNHTDGILSEFLNHIDEMERQGQKAEISAENVKNGVQIMSIHASKGLEFPIVFVCDCAKHFNTSDASKPVILSEEYGICINDVNKAMLEKIPSPAYEITSQTIIEKLRSEEMRLLYVAATRAMYKLIFTGYVKADDMPIEQADADLRKKSYLGWIRTHLTGDKTASGHSAEWTVSELMKKSYYLAWLCVPFVKDDNPRISYSVRSLAKEKEAENTITASAPAPVTITADRNIIDIIKNQIAEQYHHPDATRLAAKYTATGLAAMKRKDKEKKCELYVAKPSFAKDNGKLTGKKRGDAYHKLMEYIPMEKAMSEQEVAQFIENNTRDFLSDAERDCIKPADISRFFADDIAARMLKSGRIYREYPIFHRLSDDIMKDILGEFDENITEKPYVQGIVDMFFIEDDGIVLVDYKTDSHSDEETLSEDYSFQLKVYEEALETAFGKPVKEKYIYSFGLGETVTL